MGCSAAERRPRLLQRTTPSALHRTADCLISGGVRSPSLLVPQTFGLGADHRYVERALGAIEPGLTDGEGAGALQRLPSFRRVQQVYARRLATSRPMRTTLAPSLLKLGHWAAGLPADA